MASATMTVNERMLNFLQKEGPYNNFTVKQAQRMFGVKNVSARISELRREGHPIYTNIVRSKSGEKLAIYRLGTPTKSVRKNRFYARLRKSA